MRRRTVGSPSPSRAAGTGQAPTGTWIRSSVSRASWRASAASAATPGSGQRGHRPEHRVGRRRLDPERVGQRSRPASASAWLAASTAGQPPPSGAATSRIQSIAAGSVRNPVGSAVPTQSNSWRKRDRSAEHGVGAVRHDQRVDPLAAVLADPQHGRALRPAQPLVAVGRPVGGAERVDVDRDHARCVGRVDERVDASRGRAPRRARATGRTSPVGLVTWLTSDEPRARGHGVEDRGQRLIGPGDREGDPRDDDRAPRRARPRSASR